jgi:hypothetical protein
VPIRYYSSVHVVSINRRFLRADGYLIVGLAYVPSTIRDGTTGRKRDRRLF